MSPARRRKARPSPSARRRPGAARVTTSPDTVAAAHAALREAAHALGALEHAAALPLAEAIEVVMATLESGGTVYFCGNGGSAADAQHFACELAGRFTMERPALAAVALTTNTSSLTAIGNDFGYEQVFSRQLEGLGVAGDALIAITTSGASASVVRAVEAAHQLGMTVIGMTGRRGARFAALCDVALVTPHESTPRVQEGHLLLGHALCALVERGLFASRAGRRTGRARGARRGGAARR
ncbi:MAG TPA: SIS domain-containing protein [Candidatus Eisenbacteria bacterium]|nr:SIS domain-containing protein [Candidatus Eisenbacteria bacterium]